jgi:hypothetical protein
MALEDLFFVSPDARSGSVMENRRLAMAEKKFVAQTRSISEPSVADSSPSMNHSRRGICHEQTESSTDPTSP